MPSRWFNVAWSLLCSIVVMMMAKCDSGYRRIGLRAYERGDGFEMMMIARLLSRVMLVSVYADDFGCLPRLMGCPVEPVLIRE